MSLHDELLAIAHTVAAEVAADRGVVAVTVTGSLAHGEVDRVSDVDLLVSTDGPPGDARFEAQKATALATGGNVYGGNGAEGFAVYRFVDGVKVDLGYNDARNTDAILDKVLGELDTDPTHHLICGGVLNGLPLHGHPRVQAWQQRLRAFPDALRPAMVNRWLRFSPRPIQWEMGALRDDVFLVRERLQTVCFSLAGVMCGLNRRYHPGKLKGCGHSLAGMELAPDDWVGRMKALMSGDLREDVLASDALIEETCDLVRRELPEIDVEARLEAYWRPLDRR